MKVLVLGGTGAMGVHLIKLLSIHNIDTVVTTRKNRLSQGKIKYVRGNAQDLDFLNDILKEHWDAIVDFMVYSESSFKKRVNILLNATSQYIFLSSSRVYADLEHPIIESSPRLLDVSKDKEYLETDEYALSKARQEDILRDYSSLNWTIIRPYITYSEMRLQLGVLEKEEWLYRALHGRTIVFSSDINSMVTTLTYGLDVAKGIMSVIGKTDALGECFHITEGNSYTWKAVLKIYLDVLEKHLGYRPKTYLENMDNFFIYHPAKYQIIYDRLFNREFDNSKILKYTDVTRFTKMDIGIKNCLEEFIKKPEFKYINWKIEALKDKKTKEHTPLKEIPSIKQKIKYILFRYFNI